MPIHDISHTLSMQSPEWPEQPPLDIHLCSKIADGEIANLTHLNMVAHMGTHIDAPCHFLRLIESMIFICQNCFCLMVQK